jgi:hypothetical protein
MSVDKGHPRHFLPNSAADSLLNRNGPVARELPMGHRWRSDNTDHFRFRKERTP